MFEGEKTMLEPNPLAVAEAVRLAEAMTVTKKAA